MGLARNSRSKKKLRRLFTGTSLEVGWKAFSGIKYDLVL